MNCADCKRETTAVQVGGVDYCSICGSRYGSAAPKALTMDIAPRKTAEAAPTPAKTASALHKRVKLASGGVLDLRNAPKPIAAPKQTEPKISKHKDTPVEPLHPATPQPPAKHLTKRLEEAHSIERSPQISRFGIQAVNPPTTDKPDESHSEHHIVHTQELPHHIAAQHAAMTKLLDIPPATAKPTAKSKRPGLGITPRHRQAFAIAAAVVVMGGYIWLQNYPKLTIQAANNKAGVSATLPGYLPSSYSLAHTNSAPGQVTLAYNSPSATDSLKIDQQKTSWDSSSLLDNFVAKHADDYAAVQGQGLTIYMFNNNQATWVNHGIWYSIEGATRLSREQILKIAYSL